MEIRWNNINAPNSYYAEIFISNIYFYLHIYSLVDDNYMPAGYELNIGIEHLSLKIMQFDDGTSLEDVKSQAKQELKIQIETIRNNLNDILLDF
jgi:phytoene dehydrogenase-like protein